VDHRRQHVADFFGGAAERRQGIRLALPRDALRFFARQAVRFSLCGGDRVLPRTLGGRRRIRVGRRILGAAFLPQELATVAALRPSMRSNDTDFILSLRSGGG
jgi:hypothetical protein